MSLISKAGLLIAVAAAAALSWSPPASASPNDPCSVAFLPVCALIPVMPDLDHDVDLTTPPPDLLPVQDATVAVNDG